MKATLTLLLSGLFCCLVTSTSSAQESPPRRFSIDVLGGISSSDFYSLSPTASVNAQIRVANRWIIGGLYEHYFHDTNVGTTTRAVSLLFEYENGYSVGVYGGVDVIARKRIRLSAIVGPTISGVGGTITQMIFSSSGTSITKRTFNNDGAIGLGLWLRSEYDFTNHLYGVAQLSGHENFADELTRGSLRIGAGLRF